MSAPYTYTRTTLECGCTLVSIHVAHRPGCLCGKPEHPRRVAWAYCGLHEQKNGEQDAAYDGFLD